MLAVGQQKKAARRRITYYSNNEFTSRHGCQRRQCKSVQGTNVGGRHLVISRATQYGTSCSVHKYGVQRLSLGRFRSTGSIGGTTDDGVRTAVTMAAAFSLYFTT